MPHHDLMKGAALHVNRKAQALKQRFVAGPCRKDQAAASDAQVADFDAGAVNAVMDSVDPGCRVEVRPALQHFAGEQRRIRHGATRSTATGQLAHRPYAPSSNCQFICPRTGHIHMLLTHMDT